MGTCTSKVKDQKDELMERLPCQRAIVSWRSPCIDYVSILEDIIFEIRLCFWLSKFYLIPHYLFSHRLIIYLCWDIVWGLILDLYSYHIS